ncbi:MAG: carboxyl-terminal processing protease [Saprospiraceae bacterium]
MISKEEDKYKIWQPLALSIMLAIGMLFGYKMNNQEQSSLISFVDEESKGAVGQVEELIRFIETRYVDSIDRSKLTETALKAVLDNLDPHSVYITPEQISGVNNEMEGRFRGIGVEIFYLDDTVNIINTIADGPAAKAGIKSFDKLISINDSVVAGQGLKFAEIRKMLRGDIGDELELKLLSQNNHEKVAQILIDDIPVNSVKGGVMVNDETGYLKIDRFGANTYREFMDYFQKLTEDEGMKNIIIDLRDNPGGYLPQATNILSQLFTEKGNLMVYTQGKSDIKQEYKSTGKTFFKIDKIAVLIDENSASGSEIMAGAIQDWDRGVIIGRRSFGKGLVQEQYDLNNGGALRLTVARYYTPSGRSIQRTYDDKENYYSDYEERYYSGEFFSEDSIVKGNTDLYETMKLNRPVFGGGGITPDIFIPLDSVRFEPIYGEVMNEIPQYVFRQLAERNGELEKSEIEIFANETYNRFVSREATLESQMFMDAHGTEILNKIKSSLIKHVEGEEAVFKYELSLDDFIIRSLEYFNSSDKLTDLIKPIAVEN